jgi:voltage-gated potassium channel
MKPKERTIFFLSILLLIVFSGGVIGFMLIEHLSFLDSLYMTVITVSTVGFKEIHEFSNGGRIFTIILIIISIGLIGFSFTRITTFFVENKLRNLIVGATTKTGKKMKNHVIICGYGRNGQQAASELLAHKTDIVIIDQNNEISLENSSSHARLMFGDATNDDILIKAGIRKANSLITTLPNDADNLFVVLTARSLNPGLVIISRSFSASSEKKLRIAGVNNVVMPEKVGGAHMAKLIARPDTVEFLEKLSFTGDSPTNIEEVLCDDINSSYINKTIFEIGVRKKFGANIIGYKSSDGTYFMNPHPNTKIEPNSKLFILGTTKQLDSMKEFLRSPVNS